MLDNKNEQELTGCWRLIVTLHSLMTCQSRKKWKELTMLSKVANSQQNRLYNVQLTCSVMITKLKVDDSVNILSPTFITTNSAP